MVMNLKLAKEKEILVRKVILMIELKNKIINFFDYKIKK